MQLHSIDIFIVVIYLLVMVVAGTYMARLASKNMNSYFLGGHKIPWYILSVSNASGMFDITGTMWLVYLAFVYGMKSVYIPWIWPFFNQIFMMIYLGTWLRRSNAMTGAEWITTRFDQKTNGGRMAHLIVVIFSTISIIGFLSYGFVGIGKFAKIFLPWDLSPQFYAVIITVITGIYVIGGGLYGVIVTDVIQYFLMIISAIIIAVIAMSKVSPDLLAAVTPDGWENILIGWKLNLDWAGIMDSVNTKIANDGMSLFTVFIMMALFKGLFVSMAGPVPTQSLQRILAAKNPKEAALMSGLSSVVVAIPRYLMIGGLTVLALAFFGPELKTMGSNPDFELILPFAIKNFIPVGLMGLLLAGMLSAHMSTTSAFLNVTPAYIVNDVYKKYFRPDAPDKTYVRLSYLVTALVTIVSIVFGFFVESVDDATQWITNALWGGYAASNVLKWHWWRFNGHGYFWGMLSGLIIAMLMPVFQPMLFPNVNSLYFYPFILLVSMGGSVLGTLLTKPENDEILIKFYSSVRPWGFWKPILEKVRAKNPDFKRNTDFGRDMFNVFIGIIWQVSLMAAPLTLVTKSWKTGAILLGIIVVTSWILKKNWYNKLEEN